MKKVVLPLLFFFELIVANAQPINPPVYDETNFMEGIYNINANFYDVKAAGEAYFAQDSSLRIGNRHGYKDFIRYVQFWETRSYDDGNVSGDLNKYHELIRGYSQNRATTCTDVPGISDGFNWNFLGPKNLPDQYLGMVSSVAYYDDNGNDVIFAGSAAGGIFKTTYTGSSNPTWTCITDELDFPGIGFTDLRVLDDGPGRQYLLAGTGLLHRNYGIGILRYDLENPQNGWENVTDPGILNSAGLIEESHVHHIVIHPTDKSIVYATMGSKMYKSTSYGDTGSW